MSTIIRSVDGVWVRCVSTKGNGRDNEKTLADSMACYSDDYWVEWVLVGKLNDNPMCCPANKSVYQSRWPLGKAYHMVKISPSTKETVCYKIPGGLAVIAENVFENAEGVWMEVHKQSLMQLNVNSDRPIYACVILNGETVLFTKLYGN